MRLLAFAVGTLVLGTLLAMVGIGEVWQTLRHASAPGLAAFLAVSTAVFGAYAIRTRFVLRGIGAPAEMSLATLAGYRAATHAANFLVPSVNLAGEPVRAVLFRRAGYPWSDALLAVTVDRWIEATASAITGPICVAIFLVGSDVDPRLAIAPIAIWTIASVAMLAVYLIAGRRGRLFSILARGPRFAAAAPRLVEMESRFSDFLRTRWFPLSIAVGLVAEALIVAELALLVRAFDVHLSVPTVLGVMLGMGVASLAPVPGGVGTIEGAQVGVLSLVGGPATVGLAVGLLIRLRETLWTVVGLALLWRHGISLGTAGDVPAVTASSDTPPALGARDP